MKTCLQLAMENIKISSFDALGSALRERFPEIEWPQTRSMGTRLGELNKGQMGWWSKRPDCVERLAALLQCAPQDLGLHPNAPPSNLFLFHDFPELPPLDLTRDSPCELGHYVEDGGSKPWTDLTPWFGHAPFQSFRQPIPSGVSWLYFPRGTGRDVFWAHLKSRTPYECRTADTIATLADRFKRAGPICVKVEESAGKRDLLALAARNEGTAILVCAPFRLHTRRRAQPFERESWELQKQSRKEQEFHALTNPTASSGDGGVDRYEWRLHANWRKTLLAWIEQQLARHPDSLFDARRLENWLAEFTDYALFDTPRDVVAICRYVHLFGHRDLPKPSDRAAGSKLLGLLKTQDEHPSEFIEIVHDWLIDLDFPWNGWIDAQRWGNYVTPRETEATLNLVQKLADEPGERERARIAEQISERISEPSRHKPVDSDFLIQNEKAEIKLRPRFLADLIARERLLYLIQNHPPAKWAALCFDPPRRELVLQAMALLSDEELSRAAAKIIESYVDDATGIGATEAIFLAAGRRKKLAMPISQSLLNIAEIVLGRLASSDEFAPRPWSIAYSGEEDIWWTAACWIWSLSTPEPLLKIPSDWTAIFPGWATSLQSIEWWLVPELDADTDFEDLTAAERYLLSCAEDVAERIPLVPDNPPTVLMPFLLLRGMEHDWEIQADWWHCVLENSWAEDLVLKRLMDTNAPANAWLISMTKFLVLPGALLRKANLPHFRSPLRRWIFDNAAPGPCLTKLDAPEITYLWKWFRHLPVAFQCELLERQRQQSPSELLSWEFTDQLDDHHIEVMTRWIEEPYLNGQHAARWLWSVSPEHAKNLLLSDSSCQVKHHLINECPEEQSDLALRVIDREPDLFNAGDLRTWAIKRLPKAAGLAPRLVSLIQG